MSLHKLSAGHGYDYLIRQVAALDATHRGRTDLASYYSERGEAPGRWVGRGLAGVDGLGVGDVVTGEQMRLLFAEGRHPLDETSPDSGRVLALGVPYRPSTGSSRSRRRCGPGSPTTTQPWAFLAVPPCQRRYARGCAGSWRPNGSGSRRDVTRRVTWSWPQR